MRYVEAVTAIAPRRKTLLLPRQLLILSWLFPLTGVAIAIGYFAGLFDSHGDRTHRCLTHWARICFALAGVQVQIAGTERLSFKGPYIFMPNHSSFLDILLMLAYLPYNFRFIIKQGFFSVPLVGPTLRRAGDIPIDRKNPWKALKSLRLSADLLKSGLSIVVFPEGTRSPTGGIQDFKTALFILPIRTRIPVVPVLIEGTFEALKRGSVLLNPVPLKVTFYDPIPADLFEVRNRDLFADKVRLALSRKFEG